MIEQLITDHLNLWTSAETKRNTTGRGSNSKIELTGIKKLRELILELAVRGLLVPQDPNDEPASVLLEKIAAEKAQLIKDGKIKPPKALPKITDNEKSFDLPSHWEWVRMGNIVDIVRGITFPASEKSKMPELGRVACLRTTNVQSSIEWDDMLFIKEQYVSRKDQYLKKSDIVMSMANSRELVGKVAIIDDEPLFKTSFGGFLSVLRPRLINPTYLMALLRVPMNRDTLIGSASQTTNIANISLAKLNPLVLAIPPLNEQHRIVAKVDELMALCDQLEQQHTEHSETHHTLVTTLLESLSQACDADQFQAVWSQLFAHFDTLFTTETSIDQLKQTILQLAVMGKLVPQDPNDEPASILLEKIAAEKAQLIKDGKIKKQKPLPEISEDEKPFELPDGWIFARLENLSELITKGSSPKWQGVNYTENLDDVLFVTSENVGSFELKLEVRKFVEKKFNEVEPRSILKRGDFLMNIVGASIGRTAIYNIDDLANINQAVCLIRIFQEFFYSSYLLNFFNSSLCISYMFDKQVDNARANLSMGNIAKFIIPIPPFAEQHRIVAKVDELMALCDQLKTQLNQAQTTQQHLADTIVTNAITQ